MSLLWTAEAVRPISGPWVILHGDGSLRIVLEFSSATSVNRLQHVHLRRPAAEGEDGPQLLHAIRQHNQVQRPLAKRSQILSFHLSREQTYLRELILWLGAGRELSIAVPRLPHAEEAARVVFVGGRRWPTGRDMEAVATQLGGSIHAAVLVGTEWTASLGSGGWESAIPLLVPHREAADALIDVLVGPPGDWRSGLSFGPLAMPLIRSASEAALVMAAHLEPWLLPLDLSGTFRLDREAQPRQHSLGHMAMLIDAAHRRHRLPAVISMEQRSGCISDPLIAADARTVVAQAGGVRVLSALSDGSAPLFLHDHIAMALYAPHLLAVRADRDHLRLHYQPLRPSEQPGLTMQWRLNEDLDRQPHAGGGNAEALWTAWQQGDNQALEVLSWLPLPELLGIGADAAALRRLMGLRSQSARLFLRRLSAADTSLVNEWVAIMGNEAEYLRRDIILRQLAHPERRRLPLFRSMLISSEDGEVIRSVLRVAELERDIGLLQTLTQRLREQVHGQLPLDQDPTLQHALSHALFDSPFLSPTPLRPLARALEQRLHPLARPPVDRFLARHGRERGLE